MNNLYWQMYKNLEREVLNLSDQIHFDDKQLGVYSLKIADLLTRCAIEIEAISKQLYMDNGGDMNPKKDDGSTRYLLFDEDCIALLNRNWALDKKYVMVVSPNFGYADDINKILRPLKDANKRGGCDWKKAYQAVKHSRHQNLAKGNVKHLVRALAALYLLNVYYRNDSVELGHKLIVDDLRFGSDVFNLKSSTINLKGYTKELNIPTECDESAYVVFARSEDYKKYQLGVKTAVEAQYKCVHGKPPDSKTSQKSLNREEIFRVAAEQGGAKVEELANIEKDANALFSKLTYVAVLNKKQQLYKENENE